MASQIQWQVNGTGELIRPIVHDATIFEFSLKSEFKTLSLSVRPEVGGITPQETGVFQVIFSELYRINVVGLWNCPIISEINIWKVNAVPESCWDAPHSGWRLLFHNQVSAVEEARAAATRIIQRIPDALFVEVHCAYSGPMAFICDAVEVVI
jgi:hypothetical protein